MSQHTVRVSVELDILKNSVADMQKVLDSLKPNTKQFDALQSVIRSMTKDLQTAETQLAKGFSSNAEFTATEKIIDRISAALTRAGDITKKIQFSDLKLDQNTLGQYDKMVEDLKKARQEYSNFQKNMVKNTLAQGSNQQILQAINPDLVKASFDEIVDGIADGVKAAESELQQLQEAYNKLQEQMTKTQKVQSKVDNGSGDTLSGLLDPAAFKKFFSTKQNGDVIFKSIKGGGVRQQFLQYLQQQFDIPDNKIEELRNKTAKQIQDALGSSNFWENIIQGQQAQKIDLSNMMGDIQANVTDFTQLGQAFGTVGAQSTQFQNNIATLVALLTNFQSGVLNSNDALNRMPSSTSAATQQLQNFKSQLEQAQVASLKFQQIQNTFNSIKSTVLNFMGFTQVLNLIKRGVKDAAKNIKELDTVMNSISVVTKMSTSDLWNQVDAYTKMAQQYGVTTKGAYQVSKIYYQQGLQQKDVMALTAETLKLSKISGLDYATTTDYMTTALRGFKMQMSDASRVVDVYSALAANTAVSQQELAEAMTRTASSMESVGSTFEESSAMIATMVAVTRQSASNIGSALKSIASRYGQMKKAPEDMMDEAGDALSFNKVDAALQSVGINMKTTEGQFRSFTDVIIELSDKWNTLESTQQRYIATQFAGNRQQSRFLALVSNGELLKQNLQVAEESEGTGTAQALKTLDSLETKITQVQNAYQQFYLGIGAEDVWKGFLDGAKNVLNTLNSFPKLFGKIPVAAIAAIANLITLTKTVLIAGLSGLAATITPIIKQQLNQAGAEAQTDAQVLGSRMLTGIKQGLTQQIHGKGTIGALVGSLISSASLMIDQSTRQGQITGSAINGIGGLTQAISGGLQFFIGKNPMGLLNMFSGITNVISAVFGLIETSDEKIERLNKQSKDLSEQAAQLKGKEKTLQNLKNEYDSLREKQYDSEEAAQAFKEKQNEIAQQFPSLVESFDAVGNATIGAVQMEQALAAARLESAEAAAEAAKKELEAKQAEANKARKNFDSGITSGTHANMSTGRFYQSSLDTGKQIDLSTDILKAYDWYNKLSTVKFKPREGLTYDESLLTDVLGSPTVVDDLLGDEIQDDVYDDIFDIINDWKANFISLSEAGELIKTKLKESGETTNDLYKILGNVSDVNEQTLAYYDEYGEFLSAINEFSKKEAPTDQDRASLIESFNKLNKAWLDYKNEGGKDVFGMQDFLDYYSDIFTNFNKAFNLEDVAQKNNLSAQLKLQQTKFGKGLENILNNNDIYSLISKKIFSGGYEDVNALITQVEQLQQEWSQPSTNRQQITDNLFMMDYMSNIDKLLELMGLDEKSPIGKLIREQMKSSQATIEENVDNYLQQRAGKTDRKMLATMLSHALTGRGADTAIEQAITKDVADYLQMISSYTNNTNLADATSKGITLIQAMQKIPTTVADAINTNGLSTVESIDKSIAEIEEAQKDTDLSDKQRKALQQAKQALKSMRSRLATNLALSIQAMGDSLLKDFEDNQKTISKLNTGMSETEASAAIKKLNTWAGDSKFSSSDLMVDAAGKLVFTASAYQEAMKVFKEHTNLQIQNISAEIGKVDEVLEKINKASDQELTQYGNTIRSLLSQEEMNEFFKYSEDEEGNIQDLVLKTDANTQKLVELLNEKRANLGTELISYQRLLDLGLIAMTRQQNWKKGNYSDITKSILLLSKKDNKDLNEIEYAAVKQFRSGLSQLLEDVTTKDLDQINASDYEGVSEHMVNRVITRMRNADGVEARQKVIKTYSQYLGEDFSNLNDLVYKVAQTELKKTSPLKTDEAKDIISSLQMFDETKAYITEAQAKDLGNLLDKEYQTLIETTDNYTDSNGDKYYKLTDSMFQQLKDGSEFFLTHQAITLSKNIDEFTSLYEKSISTTGIDTDSKSKIITYAKRFGIELTEAMFKPVEGSTNFVLDDTGKTEIDQAIANGNTKLSEIIAKIDKENIAQHYDTLMSSLSNVSKIQTSGTSSLKEAQEIVDTIKNSGLPELANVTLSSVFDYSNALHGFVMNATGVQRYIKALTKALKQATDPETQEQVTDQLRMLYLQTGDLAGFLGTFDVSQQQRGSLYSRLSSGDITALNDIPGAVEYADQYQSYLQERIQAIINLQKLLSQNGELTAKDIANNRLAFSNSRYKDIDSGTLAKNLTEEYSTTRKDPLENLARRTGTDYFEQYQNADFENNAQRKQLLLKLAQQGAIATLDDVKALETMTDTLWDAEKQQLTQLGQQYFEQKGTQFYSKASAIQQKAIAQYPELQSQIQQLQAEQRETNQNIHQELLNKLVEVNNTGVQQVISTASDDQLKIAKDLSDLIGGSLISVDEKARTITFNAVDFTQDIKSNIESGLKDKVPSNVLQQAMASIKSKPQVQAQALLQLLQNAENVEAKLATRIQSLFGEKSGLVTQDASGIWSANPEKIFQEFDKLEDINENTKKEFKKAKEQYDADKLFERFITDGTFKYKELEDAIEKYNAAAEKDITVPSESDLIQVGEGEYKWKKKSLSDFLEDAGLEQMSYAQEVLQSWDEQLFTVIQKMLEGNVLNKKDLETLGHFDINAVQGFGTSQNLTDSLDVYYKQIQNTPELLYNYAQQMLKYGKIDQASEAISKILGNTQPINVKEAIQTGDIDWLNKVKDNLGIPLYQALLNSFNFNPQAIFADIISQSIAYKEGQRGYIDITQNPELQQAIDQLNLSNLLESVTVGDTIIGYWVNDLDEIQTALSDAIMKSNLDDSVKRSLLSRIHKELNQELNSNTLDSFFSGAYTNISYDTISGVQEALGGTAGNLNDFINKFFTKQGDYYTQTVQQRQNMLKQYRDKLSKQQQNAAQRSINQQKQKQSKQFAAKNALLNWDNIGYDVMDTLSKAYNMSYKELSKWFKYDENTGKFIPQLSAESFAKNQGVAQDKDVQKTLEERLQQRQQAVLDVFNGFNEAITSGLAQRVEVNKNNQGVLKVLADSFPQKMKAIYDEQHNIIAYSLTGSLEDIDAFIETLEQIRDDPELRQAMPKVSDQQLNALIQSFSSTKKQKSGKELIGPVLENYLDSSYETVEKASRYLGLQMEDFADEINPGEYSILGHLDTIKDKLTKKLNLGQITQEVYDNYIARIDQIKYTESAAGAMDQIIANSTNISDEMINHLVSVSNLTREQIMSVMTDLGGGQYAADTGALLALIKALDLGTNELIMKHVQTQVDETLDSLSWVSSQQISGTTSVAEMRATLDKINDGLKQALSLSDIYEYNEQLHAYTLKETGVAVQMQKINQQINEADGEKKKLLQAQKDIYLNNLADTIDFSGYFSAESADERSKQQALLQRSVKNYNRGQWEAYGEKGEQISDDLFNAALNGDFQALQSIYAQLEKEFSFADQKAALEFKTTRLMDATEAFTSSVGTHIDEFTAELLNKAGGQAKQIGKSKVWEITKAIDPSQLSQAYLTAYFEGVSKNLSQDKLNNLLLESWKASSTSTKGISDALKNATSMTLDQLGEFLLTQGEKLTATTLSELQLENIFSRNKDGTIRLNLEKFADKFNIDKSSQEYLEAYSAMQDTIIKQQTQQSENIESEINSILQAKPGDKLNLSTLYNLLGDELASLGLKMSEGIATIAEDTNLTQVAAMIAQACADAGAIIPEQLQAIQEAIEQILQGFIDALAGGIEGGLSSADKHNIITQTKQILGKELSDNDFIHTAEGFQLTSEAATDLYSTLREIDNVSSTKLLDSLSQRMFGSESGMKTMTGQMAKIAELEREIAEAREKAAKAQAGSAQQKNLDATISKLEKQLALQKQLAQTNMIRSPESYDFMGQSLPSYLQGPENYWNAWGNAFEAMRNAGENGGYAIQDFYNIVNEMNNIAGLTGKQFTIFGETLDGGIQGMTRLIEKGFATIKNVDGKGAKVTLEGIGIDFETGAAGMSGNIEEGIHAMAQSQIDMLDGLIAFLETIVAMEKLGDVDTDFSGSIDVGEVFKEGSAITGAYTQGFTQWQNQLKEALNKDKELKETFQGMKTQLNGTTSTLYELTTMSAKEQLERAIKYAKDKGIQEGDPDYEKTVKEYSENYAEFINKYYQAVTSDAWNEKELISPENFNILAQTGLDLQYTLPDGNTITIKNGQWIMSSEPGKWVVDGVTYTNVDEALKARDKKETKEAINTLTEKLRGNLNQGESVTVGEDGTKTINVKGLKFEIKFDEQKGSGVLLNGKHYDTMALAQKAMVDAYISSVQGHAATTAQARVALHLDVYPEITSASELTSQQVAQLKRDGLTTAENIRDAVTKMGGEDAFQAKYKFKLGAEVDPQFDQDLQARASQADVTLTADITADGSKVTINGPVQVDLVAKSIDTSNVSIESNGTTTPGSGTTTMPTFTAQGTDTSASSNTRSNDAMQHLGRAVEEGSEGTGQQISQAAESIASTVESALSTVANFVVDAYNKVFKQNEQEEAKTTNDKETTNKNAGSQNEAGLAEVKAAQEASQQALTETATTIGQAGEAVAQGTQEAIGGLNDLSAAQSDAASSAQTTANAITGTYNGLPSGPKPPVSVSVQIAVSATNGTVTNQSPGPGQAVAVAAKGNVALASGKKTLMGQLGPELVVSNGHYFVAGQSGAQMVDLAPDAIVFNHLQTRKLLSSGHAGRGKPITNQHNAVAWAKGTGPAMASASAVLAALKQIRAMWQAMLGASMKDLGALAGNEGGGGGGGGGKKTPPQLKAILDDIERWYNLVRQIDRIEQDITHQETLQAKLQSDRIANGRALYNSQKEQLKLLDAELIRNQQLADLQQSWYKRRIKDFTESDYSIFYRYDKDNGLQLVDGINKGMDALFKLNEKGVYGQTEGAATNAKTQIQYLRSLGFDIEHLKYNGDGTKIDESSDEYKDNPDKVYEDMMNNFWDNLDGWKDELDSLYDEYRDQLNTIIDNEDKRNQILQAIVDNQLSVQQDVLKAIESREQKLIDQLQDQRDAIEKSTQDFIDGLSDQLKQQRQMYENEEAEKELVKLRRQVAILQRSGGSASQIRSLQEQIAAKQQDQYFTAQEQQIAAIQKASDLQISRMDTQIDIMTKTLEYQKQNGLLWNEVYDIMAATPEQIRQFIMENTPDFQSASALDVAEKIRDIDLRINEWTAYRDDEGAPDLMGHDYYDWESYKAARTEIYGDKADDELIEKARKVFDETFAATGDVTVAGKAADEIFRQVLGDIPLLKGDDTGGTTPGGTTPGATIGPGGFWVDGVDLSKYPDLMKLFKGGKLETTSGKGSGGGNNYSRDDDDDSGSTSTKTKHKFQASKSEIERQAQVIKNLEAEIEQARSQGHSNIAAEKEAQLRRKKETYQRAVKSRVPSKYASGGLVNYTGLAQVDGTPQHPEAFLNSEQTQLLREHLFGSSNSLLALAQQIVQQMRGSSYILDTNNREQTTGLNIEKIDVNVNVEKVANDYDVQQMGDMVMDRILSIARKSGTRGLSRR